MRLYIPKNVCSRILQWGHSLNPACHPGFHRPVDFSMRHFWWSSMAQDTQDLASCTVCARSKSSHQPSYGLLQTLEMPTCPWSHIALDLVTGPSSGHTCILTIIDCFSKAVHFVPKLPTVTETADLLILHIVHLHGIPQDVMTVRGPQFSSQVWKVFCLALGASASLSSGYHPQTN